jgi:hypothetical protein
MRQKTPPFLIAKNVTLKAVKKMIGIDIFQQQNIKC